MNNEKICICSIDILIDEQLNIITNVDTKKVFENEMTEKAREIAEIIRNKIIEIAKESDN